MSRSGEFFRHTVWGLLLASAFFLVAIVVLTLLVRQWSWLCSSARRQASDSGSR